MADAPPLALILGASSGFGAATARVLARDGMDVVGVHLDRRAGLALGLQVAADVRAAGRRALFFNLNAADDGRRTEILDAVTKEFPGSTVRVLMHSLAFGTLRPLIGDEGVTRQQLEMTHDVMANSLVYWVSDLYRRQLLAEGGRIFAMTSSGSTRALYRYGPVGAAKAALEAYCRQLAKELGPQGISVNAIRAGITRTAALEKIPGAEEMMHIQRLRNPRARLTTPDDVAEVIGMLSRPGAAWVNGTTLGIDGGEDIVGWRPT